MTVFGTGHRNVGETGHEHDAAGNRAAEGAGLVSRVGMSRPRRWFGTLGLVMFTLVGSVAPTAAPAATFTHYGPPNAAAWTLAGHSASGGAGTLPNEYPAPTPWSQPAGDYCTAYKFAQPNAPMTSAPFATLSNVALGSLTGFDPGAPRESYQLRHNAQEDSSACQAKGSSWGFWTNANTANNYCSNWCGVRHDYSTGQATRDAAVVKRIRRGRQARDERVPARADVLRRPWLVLHLRDAPGHDDVAAA